jgi:uncharacterized protein
VTAGSGDQPPRPYPQLLRGPTFRWWRPVASVGVAIALAIVGLALITGTGAVLELIGAGPGASEPDVNGWLGRPVGFLYTNLVLAGLIPVAVLATWGGFSRRPRWVSSVAPGVRWGWLLRCALIALAVLGTLTGGLQVLAGYRWTPEPDWGWLVLITLLTTPLQAAGEEYLFRGWLLQLIGATIPDARVGAVAGGAVSSTLFALAHGQQDLWLFADRFAFGVLACWLVWRTGGLEAGMAMHGANNVIALLLTIGAGDLSETLNASQGNPLAVGYDVLSLLLAIGLMVWLARRRHLVRLFTPPGWPA